jgi:hypothetical protein
VKCDGYRDLNPRLCREEKPALLLPRDNMAFLVPRTAASLSFYTPSSIAKFSNQEEYQYFLHFRDQMTIDLSGSMPEAVWSQVIPRAIDSELSLRNLTVAVSAMDKARHSSSMASHIQFAVSTLLLYPNFWAVRFLHEIILILSFQAEKYGEALREIQELISSRTDIEATRVSLIASLLIFCFENLQGETELATKHAKTALNFMRKQLTSTVHYYSEQQATSSVPGLEDEVLEVLVNLDCMFITSDYMAGKRLLEVKFVEKDIAMPRAFRNIQEARLFLREWQYRAMPYLPRLRDVFSGVEDSGSPWPGHPGYFENTMTLARAWFKALTPMLKRVSMDPTSREFLKFAITKTSGLTTCLSLQRACLGDGSKTPGLFEPESIEMVELGSHIVQNPYYRRTFAFDIGLIDGLFVVCMVCRKKKVCEEALRILKLAKGRVEITSNAEKYAVDCEAIIEMRFPSAGEKAMCMNS